MIKANVKFLAPTTDPKSLPNPYYSYLVIASPWEEPDSGVASAIPMAEESPRPNPKHVLVFEGGEEAAYRKMLDTLRSHEDAKNLKESIDRD